MVIHAPVVDHEAVSDVMTDDRESHGQIAILDWEAKDGYLLQHVVGDDALWIEVDPFRELPHDIFQRISDSCSIVCFQINLSVRYLLPIGLRDLARRFSERGVYVVNGIVQDIRKSTLQAHLSAIGLPSVKADPTGPADEALFVKSNLNYGGKGEQSLPQHDVAAAGIDKWIAPGMTASGYRVVQRGQLPEEVWKDPSRVVEKYVGNAENSFYRVYFSGEQVIIVKAFAAGIIKKLSNNPRDINYVSDLDFLKSGPGHLAISQTLQQEVATFVENTPVEFGCIDIVHDGRDHHYIIDLNVTPYGGNASADAALNSFLKSGIANPHRRKLCRCLDSPLAGS